MIMDITQELYKALDELVRRTPPSTVQSRKGTLARSNAQWVLERYREQVDEHRDTRSDNTRDTVSASP